MRTKLFQVSATPMYALAFFFVTLLANTNAPLQAQTVLVDFKFQSATLPAGFNTNLASVSTGGAVGSCTDCSIGRLNVELNGYLEMALPNLGTARVTMKSAGSAARQITLSYRKKGQAGFTTAGVIAAPQAGGWFDLHILYPEIMHDDSVTIRLQNAASGGQAHIHDVYITESTLAGTSAEILAFKIPNQIGNENINSSAGTVSIQVPFGTALNNVTPSTVTLSAGATINPPASQAQNFSGGNPVAYTVTGGNGAATKNWTVTVSEKLSADKEITAFTLTDNQIGNAIINTASATVTLVVPSATDLNNITPVNISLSAYATINPLPNVARNFSSAVTYTVTAQDGSTKLWTVNTTTPDALFTSYEAEEASFTGTVDNNHTGFTGSGFINFLSGGENQIVFTICQTAAGSRTAQFRYALQPAEARPGKLFVNDIEVATLPFASTGAWNTWANETITLALEAGINNIKITWNETDGPNLDKLMLNGAPCNTYPVTVNATNGGTVTLSPQRPGNRYFEGETLTLLANSTPSLQFTGWQGSISGTANPIQLTITEAKNITAQFEVVPTYTLTVNVTGVGQVLRSPQATEYPAGSTVTLTANTLLGSNFIGWSGQASGAQPSIQVLMDGNKTINAAFTSTTSLNFNNPVGFASVNTGSTYPDFNSAVTGGQGSTDTLWVNGPADFDSLAWKLYYRNRAYRLGTTQNGMKKAPLVIVFKEGIYPEGVSSSSAWGNSMLTIQEQGDLTIIGQQNVVLKFGFNIKRSWNIIIRNLHFQDYYDDGINIGEPETHHIWIDHCTVGHPTTRPANTEHPDGGIDVKSGASYVTISWCLIRNSWKTSLVGHSDGNAAEDVGKLKVTYYANHFINTNSRNPRVRFGEVHVLNNLNENVQLYGIAAANGARVVAEGNFYLNTRWPMYADRTVANFRAVYGNNTDNNFTSKTGNIPATYLKQFNNDYDDSGLPVITAQINPAMLNPGGRSVKFDELNPEAAFSPSSYYNYTALSPQVVRSIVPLFAGADKVDFFNPPPPQPVLNLSTAPAPLTQYLGTPSAAKSYTLSATQLTGNLIITPAAPFEISADTGKSWATNAQPLTLPVVNGNIAPRNLLVRLFANTLGNYSGTLMHQTPGLDGIPMPVSGTTIPSIYPPGTAVVVAQDGTGNYTTVQAAIDAAPAGRTTPYIIFIKNGKYFEKVTVPSNKPFIHLVGESVANVLLYHNTGASDPLPGGGTVGTQNSASFTVNAPDFAAFNITFANTYGDGTQAVAVLVNNDRAVFENCRFLGNQDTLYVKGSGTPRHYFKNCYIDGNVDFIFGSSIAVFDSSVVYAKSRTNAGNSYITAANTPAGQNYGFVFRDAVLPNNTGATQYFLGRPWQNSNGSSPAAHNKTVWLSSTMAPHIRPEGWAVWDAGTNTSLITYAEYASRNFDSTPVNITNRVPWSLQLTQQQANDYTLTNMFGAWNPCAVAASVCVGAPRPIAVANFRTRKGNPSSIFEWNISWAKTGIEYTLYRANTRNGTYTSIGSVIATDDVNINFSLTDQLPEPGTAYYYYLQASLAGFESHITDTLEVSSKPTLIYTGTLQPFVQYLPEASASQNITLSGSNLLGNVTITPPLHFEVSSNGGSSWIAHPNNLLINPGGSTLAPTTLQIRLKSTIEGDYSGTITITSTDAEDLLLSLNGRTLAQPTTPNVSLQYWPLTENANDLATERAIGVEPSSPSFNNLFLSNGTTVNAIKDYTTQYGQAFGASANGDGSWGTGVGGPGGTLRRTHYQQFTVTASNGYRLKVDSLYLTAAFYNTSSNTRLAIVYSKTGFSTADSTNIFTQPGPFNNAITLANQTSGPTNRYALSVAGPDGITLEPGQTLTLRLYYSCGSTSSGRYAMIKDVRITGTSQEAGNLPLQLLQFAGTNQADKVLLNWRTAAEQNLSHFEVQRSATGIEFFTVGKVAAQNRVGQHYYQFADIMQQPSQYYRLKMVDRGGSFSLSQVLHFSKENHVNKLAIFPNPAHSSLWVQYPPISGSGSLKVVNAMGQPVMQYPLPVGAHQQVISIQKLPAGVYWLQLHSNNGMQVVKWMKE